jgi:hypothetical protein
MLRHLNYGLLMLMTAPAWAQSTGTAATDAVATTADATKESLGKMALQMNTNNVEGWLVPTVFFGCIIAVVAIAMKFRSKSHAETHKTLQLMIEKGVPVSPELFYTQQNRRPKSNLQRGVILTMVGAAIVIALAVAAKDEPNAWAYGLIPMFLGLGYLIVAFVESKQSKV